MSISTVNWQLPQCSILEYELNMSFNSSFNASLSSSYQTVQNIHNGTVHPMMVEESHYFWWKASIIFLDIFGLTFNGLGIDMIWHGVEINHAVYFVILQDLCLAFVTTLVSQIFNWFFWYDDLLWFRFYGLLAILPFIFHNWAWASVAQLRYFLRILIWLYKIPYARHYMPLSIWSRSAT